MKTKRLLGCLVLLFVALLLGGAATAQITSVKDLEGVYSMKWESYYINDLYGYTGMAGTAGGVVIRAIEGCDSVKISNFYQEGITVKAAVDIDGMAISFPYQVVSDTLVTDTHKNAYGYAPGKFRAIGPCEFNWDYEEVMMLDTPRTGTISSERKIMIKEPMATIGNYDRCENAFEKIVLTYESALPAEPAVRGDVNGDGHVDVADVNAIINIMLGKEE